MIPLPDERSEEERWRVTEWTCAALGIWVAAVCALIAYEMAVYYLSKWIW